MSSWASSDNQNEIEGAIKVAAVYRKKNLLIINNELFELNKVGFCRDGEDEGGKFKACILEILPRLQLSQSLSADSVFVFEKQFYQPDKSDSVTTRLFVSAAENLLVKKELLDKHGKLIWQERLIRLERK